MDEDENEGEQEDGVDGRNVCFEDSPEHWTTRDDFATGEYIGRDIN